MEILKYPNPILRQTAVPVEAFDEALDALAGEMFKAMYKSLGVGLAAPQVGHSIRLIVMDTSKELNSPLVLVNPKITKVDGVQSYEEGCLSFPGVFSKIVSAKTIEVTYQDTKGVEHASSFEGMQAVAIQHEIDHLDGKLFIDRMKPKDRARIKSRAFGGK
jgi:peptide deformylase